MKIKNPGGDNAVQFINRKGFYSLNVQVTVTIGFSWLAGIYFLHISNFLQMVVDAKLRIRNIVARWRGCTHDARIWNECRLKRRFQVENHEKATIAPLNFDGFHIQLKCIKSWRSQ